MSIKNVMPRLAGGLGAICFALTAGLRQHFYVPVFHECQRCAACCRWPGQVRLTSAEMTRLAVFKRLSEFDFIQQFTRLTHDRRGLALLDKANGECIFLEAGACAVQPVKPQQCRDFPNLWNFPGAEKVCHALPHEVSEAEYLQRVAQATGRSSAEVALLVRAKEIRVNP